MKFEQPCNLVHKLSYFCRAESKVSREGRKGLRKELGEFSGTLQLGDLSDFLCGLCVNPEAYICHLVP